MTSQDGFWAIVNPFARARRYHALSSVHSRDAFHGILDRERARADRTGHEFSVVVFDAARHNGTAAACLKELARFLAKRIRTSDEVGWFSEKSIAVLLPATAAEGAWVFADDVDSRIKMKIPSVDRTVYTYPTKWMTSGDSRGDSGKRDRATDIPRTSSIMMHDGGRSIEPLEPVLNHPMPSWKRALDIAGSMFALILFSPVFMVLAVFIKIVSPGPVFYKQVRIGHLGKTFTFWKFRTMHVGNDSTGHQRYLSSLIKGDAPMIKLDADRDPRIIPCGRFLRQSCVDELPQLVNVLKGEMSLVGPRPCLPYEADEYLLWHARRFDTVPGMTGLWQVSGKNKLTFKEMIRLDIHYSSNISIRLDLKILLKTFPAIATMVADHISGRKAARETAGIPASPEEA